MTMFGILFAYPKALTDVANNVPTLPLAYITEQLVPGMESTITKEKIKIKEKSMRKWQAILSKSTLVMITLPAKLFDKMDEPLISGNRTDV